MSKVNDLNHVLTSLPKRAVKNLARAIKQGTVCHGRFHDDAGRSCLMRHLSMKFIRIRDDLIYWSRMNNLDLETVKRVIVGWDAGHRVIEGCGYESFYPAATYTLTERDVKRALLRVLGTKKRVLQES